MIHTVVIDPGHGGKDVGAVGPTGLQEKEVALKVALYLKRLIEQRLRIRAILTRSSDEFVPLGERARTALENDGRMFISLHCNATPRRQRRAGGTEVYFLSEARTEEAREVARRENAALEFEGKGAAEEANGNPVLRDIFEGMSSDQYLKESQDLAAEIRGAVARAGGMLKDRGVKQAGFYVMKGTQARMPSVLVEMAFISSPREERLLRRDAFQRQLAEAIFDGVRAFKAKTEREVVSKQ
jgi:N-acetylmuramoyl-L-alanine amidase